MGAAGTVASLAGSSIADPLLTALSRLKSLTGSAIGPAVDGFEAILSELVIGYSTEPVDRLHVRLDALLSLVFEQIGYNPPPAYQRRLFSLAGWTAGLLACVMRDSDDRAAAWANTTLMMEYGRRADDARLVAYAFDRQAMLAADNQQLSMALDLAGRGLAAGDAAFDGTAVRLRFAQAHLNARLGRQREAAEAADRLRADMQRLPATEIGEAQFAISNTFLDSSLGRISLALGRPAEAEPFLRRSVAHYERERHPSRLADCRLNLAMAVMVQQPDEAAALAGQALSGERRTGGLVSKAHRVEAALSLRHPALVQAHALRDRLLALSSGAQAPS